MNIRQYVLNKRGYLEPVPVDIATIYTNNEGGGLHFTTGETCSRKNDKHIRCCCARRCATINTDGHVHLFENRVMLPADVELSANEYDPFYVAANWVALGALPPIGDGDGGNEGAG